MGREITAGAIVSPVFLGIGLVVIGLSTLGQIQAIDTSIQYTLIVLAAVVAAVMGIMGWVDARIRKHNMDERRFYDERHDTVLRYLSELKNEVSNIAKDVFYGHDRDPGRRSGRHDDESE